MDDRLHFTEAALRSQDGKEVPLKDKPGGNVIGTAILKYDPEQKALVADLQIEDPELAELLRGPMPIFRQES